MNPNIYKYHNGKEEVFADPFDMELALFEALPGVNVEEKLDLLSDKTISQYMWLKTFKDLSPGVYAMFKMAPVNLKTGEGVTIDEILALWSTYTTWRAEVKKNTPEPQSAEQPTDSGSPSQETTDSDGSGDAELIMNSSSDSGSTGEPQPPHPDPLLQMV